MHCNQELCEAKSQTCLAMMKLWSAKPFGTRQHGTQHWNHALLLDKWLWHSGSKPWCPRSATLRYPEEMLSLCAMKMVHVHALWHYCTFQKWESLLESLQGNGYLNVYWWMTIPPKPGYINSIPILNTAQKPWSNKGFFLYIHNI
jgi:hypothetical protein